MANSWLRLWHDMPNDPKWRTIARVSGQPIALVQAVYLQLLVSASQNPVTDETGVTLHVVTVTNEDISSALDVTECNVDSVTSAMQGRVLDGKIITGWDKRQASSSISRNGGKPAKSGAQRVREYRERQKEKVQSDVPVTPCNVTETLRNDVTTQNRIEEIRIDKELKDPPLNSPKGKSVTKFNPLEINFPDWLNPDTWHEWVNFRAALRKPIKTSQGAYGAINELEKFRREGFSPEAVIQNSIAHEYQGLYPPSKGWRAKNSDRNINDVCIPDNTIPEGFVGGVA